MKLKRQANLGSIRKKILPVLKRKEVSKAALFGPFARGDEKKRSDIDILVELGDKKTLLDIVQLKLELQDKVKQNVDVVENGAIHLSLKDRIMREKVEMM